MQISSALAGYSLGKADLLRRAMGKKKAEVMAKEKAGFLDGAKAKKVDPKVAERVFDLMEKFAGYGFNRSHSAAYGLLTYQTAYLKRYYPVEFFAGLLTCDKDDTDAVVKFIAEARAQGIAVLRPDINESDTDFTVVMRARGRPKAPATGEGARSARRRSSASASAAVKGVGEGAVEIIKAARDAGRPVPVAVRLLQPRRRAQGEPQGARGAGEVGRVRRHRRARTASRARKLFARDRRRVGGAAARPARAGERPDLAAGALRRRRQQRQRLGRALAEDDSTPTPTSGRPRSMLAFEKESAGLLHQRPPARPLPRRDPPLRQRHHRQLRREGRARRGDPGRASSATSRSAR